MYLVDWKEILPVNEVHVPRRLEGSPSSQRGTCTSLTGRASFRSTRYMYLVDWKEALPVSEVRVPRRLEGNPSSRPSPLSGLGYPWGYPDIRRDFTEKGASAPESAPASGYPLALAGIRQRIADIRDGLSPPISIARIWAPLAFPVKLAGICPV
ncbi:hypothetical protein PGT21_031881 [Puccinia graminis f. sp. tritici]|uniref:Uncharacterized protein n=1 Tax=Puccinia graminis f. sp. tritici TaxID=56615 RepID=A0A5B0MP58_PUCGR|nr:hypothetical protein PGT21_031881 [Puccinia graminis f. sp. tritici]